jgi:hypothetical protein
MGSVVSDETDLTPAVDVSRFEPVGDWSGGQLRVFRYPLTSAKLDPAEEYAPFGRGYAIPVAGFVSRPDGVRVHFELIDGVPRCVAIEVGEQPAYVNAYGGPHLEPARWLTGTYLREMPLETFVKQAAQGRAVRLYRRPRGEIVGVRVGAPLTEKELLERLWDQRSAVREVGAAVEALVSGARKPGRKPIPDETLAKVATAVREAEAQGQSAIAAVMERFPEIVPSTAKKYIGRARDRGFLPAKPEEEKHG